MPKTRIRNPLALSAALTLALSAALATAAAPPTRQAPEPTTFARVATGKDGKPAALQIATARYVAAKADATKDAVTVDLVGVVHIADRKFYEKLDATFAGYDAVLYEGVKGEPSDKALRDAMGKALAYDSMAAALGMTPQHKHIDYKRANFVHADVEFQDLEQIARKKGDDLTALFLNGFTGRAGPLDPASALWVTTFFSGRTRMKTTFARVLADQGEKTGDAKKVMEYVIDERNEACLKVLEKQLAGGKKKVAIFYGSSHMPHFERRLTEGFGMRRESVTYHDAWDLTPPTAPVPAKKADR